MKNEALHAPKVLSPFTKKESSLTLIKEDPIRKSRNS